MLKTHEVTGEGDKLYIDMDGQNMSPNILAYAEEQIVGLVISNQKPF
jgi:hypothetical protein